MSLARGSLDGERALIEGVMGLLEGRSPEGLEGSNAERTSWRGARVILVTDASARARSAAAIAEGFANHPHGPGTARLMSLSLVNGHSHDGIGAHVHGGGPRAGFHESDSGWQSFVLHSHGRQDSEVFAAAVQTSSREHPILRTKGFVRAPGREQAVRTRVDGRTDRASHSQDSRLVFIGYHPARRDLAAPLSILTSTRWH